MSDFTIEQLEALKEGTTPGPWEVGGTTALGHVYVGASNTDVGGLVAEVGRFDAPLIASAPDLVDALIAEKQAHAELRKRIEERIRELKQPLCSHMPEGDELDDYLEQWGRQSYEAEILTRILEGDDG